MFAAALRLWAPGENGAAAGDAAQAAAQEARQAFEAGDFDRMVTVSREAYEASGDLFFLYSQAQAERFRGNCEAAIALYGRILAAEPTGKYAELPDHARDGIHLCEEELAANPVPVEPKPEPPPPRVEDETPRAPEMPEPQDRSRPSRDALGAVLLSTGVVATAAGATLLVSADFARRRANNADDEATHIDNLDRSRTLMISGAVVGGVGVALLAGATARYLVLRRSRASASLVPFGRGVAVVGRF